MDVMKRRKIIALQRFEPHEQRMAPALQKAPGMFRRAPFLLTLFASLAACSSSQDQAPPRFELLQPPPAHEDPGSDEDAGEEGWSEEPHEQCGDEGLPCCSGQCVDETLACGPLDICEPAPSWPEPAPEPATACGKVSEACCGSGAACFNGSAKCCTACSGPPDYKCQCSDSFVEGGACKLCCVVCKDGHHKDSAITVGADQSCNQAAAAWCQKNRQVGADEKSGWKNQCD